MGVHAHIPVHRRSPLRLKEAALPVEAIDVEPIEVIVERREIALERVGFYERRDEGWGRFETTIRIPDGASSSG